VIGGRLREQRIIEGWPDILRLVGSIRAGTVIPSHVITKLAANPRQSSLARALIEIGRLEHTRFLLDLLRSPTLRHEMQASLNKGEASNNLRKAVFFNRLGQIRDRAYESQLHRARGLNLLIAASCSGTAATLVRRSMPCVAAGAMHPTISSPTSGRWPGITST
jgi:TnpA family transposase